MVRLIKALWRWLMGKPKRGRPRGSKNRPKSSPPVEIPVITVPGKGYEKAPEVRVDKPKREPPLKGRFAGSKTKVETLPPIIAEKARKALNGDGEVHVRTHTRSKPR